MRAAPKWQSMYRRTRSAASVWVGPGRCMNLASSWTTNERPELDCVVEGRFGVLCTVVRLKPVPSDAKWRGFGTGTPHAALVHQLSRESLLLKGDIASSPIALDLQAAKPGSLLFATGHPKLSLQTFHGLVAGLKGRNRKRTSPTWIPPVSRWPCHSYSKALWTSMKSLAPSFSGSSRNAIRCRCQHFGLWGQPYQALCTWATLVRPQILHAPSPHLGR